MPASMAVFVLKKIGNLLSKAYFCTRLLNKAEPTFRMLWAVRYPTNRAGATGT
jgi:hypothetical protein